MYNRNYHNKFTDHFGSVNRTNVMNHRKKAALYLFEPRQMINAAQRSYAVTFSESAIDNIVDMSTSRQLLKPSTISRYIDNSVITPSSTSRVMRLDAYNDTWTFTAIVEDSTVAIFNPSVRPNKLIISGFCQGEPILPSSIGSNNLILNEMGCELVVLNVVQVASTQDSGGVTERVISQYDIPRHLRDHVDTHGMSSYIDDGRDLYRTDPSNAMRTTTNSSVDFPSGSYADYGYEDFEFESTPSVDLNLALVDHTKEVLDAKKNLPSEYLKELFVPLYNGAEESRSEAESNGFGSASQMIASNIQRDVISNGTVIDDMFGNSNLFSDRMRLKSFLDKYSPEVQTFQAPPPTTDAIDVDVISPVSQFSALVAQTLPTYMYRAGLSAVGFTYDSYYDSIQLGQIDPLSPMAADELERRIYRMMDAFKMEICSMMKHIAGDFILAVLVNPNAHTVVKLEFFDFSPIDAPYIGESIFKGYTDFSFGGKDDVVHNASQVHSAIKNYSARMSTFL